ncbi:MAG: hypothetical protein CMJ06_05140 [Pelagibacterales bacterium]|nr:hypothetical protein [Pelagibacterales bacterium]OUU61549.1 MAG: hypothetical protein CBC22_07205 [Alphaproteobacteria bacterium TMED62]
MYLNIINNINNESKRKIKKLKSTFDQEKNKDEDNYLQFIDDADDYSYHSVFYGNLTRTWIRIRN